MYTWRKCSEHIVVCVNAGGTWLSHHSQYCYWRLIPIIYLFCPSSQGWYPWSFPVLKPSLVTTLSSSPPQFPSCHHRCHLHARSTNRGKSFAPCWYKMLNFCVTLPCEQLKQSGWIGNYALGSSYISLPWWVKTFYILSVFVSILVHLLQMHVRKTKIFSLEIGQLQKMAL